MFHSIVCSSFCLIFRRHHPPSQPDILNHRFWSHIIDDGEMASEGRSVKVVNLKSPEDTNKIASIVKGLSSLTMKYSFLNFLGWKVDTLAQADIDSIDINPKFKPVMELLKDRCNLIQEFSIGRLRRKPRFALMNLPKDRLVYQQKRTAQAEGFYVPLEKSLKKRKCNKRIDLKFGQIRPYPTDFDWRFPWEGSSSRLKQVLQRQDRTGFNNLSSQLRREILDHLVAEFYVYFRRSIPPRYLDQVLVKLINQFPTLNDESHSGFVRSFHFEFLD